jgi:hypothetical protein
MNATVNSGNDVEKAIMLKPTAVLPSPVILETLTALLIERLLAEFRTTKDTPMINRFIINSVGTISAISLPSSQSLLSAVMRKKVHLAMLKLEPFELRVCLTDFSISCTFWGAQLSFLFLSSFLCLSCVVCVVLEA